VILIGGVVKRIALLPVVREFLLVTSLYFGIFLNLSADILVREGEVLLKLKANAAYSLSSARHLKITKGEIAKLSLSAAKALQTHIVQDVPYDPLQYQLICKELLSSGIATHCSPNFVIKNRVTPDDAYFSFQKDLDAIDIRSAWDTTTCDSSVTVAVLDTGIDLDHPDLVDNLWVNSGEIPGNGIDDDGNGFVDDVHGINLVASTLTPDDDNGHGTHVAGTIAAKGNNQIGISGICWNAKVMAVKFLSANGSGDLYSAIEGIEYAVSKGARIINASWGTYGDSSLLKEAIKTAAESGVIISAAAGNEANDTDQTPHYPSAYDLSNIISVAAVHDSHIFADSFSNYGKISVDIGAPGVSILSTIPDAAYDSYSGTSMAAPHVSGVIAMLLSLRPDLTVAQLKQALFSSVTYNTTLTDKVLTKGVLNAKAAIDEALLLPSVASDNSYKLSLSAVSSATLKKQSGKITSGYSLKISSVAINYNEALRLKLFIKNRSCDVSKYNFLTTTGSINLSGRLISNYKGVLKFELRDQVGNLKGRVTSSASPKKYKKNKASSTSICRALARRVKL
jgi:subtilisin family serine protease